MNFNTLISDQIKNFRTFLKQAKRVLKVSTKPDKEEYWAVAKVTFLGMALIGLIAYVIRTVSILLGG